MILIKKNLLKKVLEELNNSQNDCFVESTQEVIDEIKEILKLPNKIDPMKKLLNKQISWLMSETSLSIEKIVYFKLKFAQK